MNSILSCNLQRKYQYASEMYGHIKSFMNKSRLWHAHLQNAIFHLWKKWNCFQRRPNSQIKVKNWLMKFLLALKILQISWTFIWNIFFAVLHRHWQSSHWFPNGTDRSSGEDWRKGQVWWNGSWRFLSVIFWPRGVSKFEKIYGY